MSSSYFQSFLLSLASRHFSLHLSQVFYLFHPPIPSLTLAGLFDQTCAAKAIKTFP